MCATLFLKDCVSHTRVLSLLLSVCLCVSLCHQVCPSIMNISLFRKRFSPKCVLLYFRKFVAHICAPECVTHISVSMFLRLCPSVAESEVS